MKSAIFFISAYVTGFIAAVPAGPVQIEIVRRSIRGHMRSSFMVIVGALAADIIYGMVAFFGIAPFLKEEKVMAIFWFAGAVILLILGGLVTVQSLSTGIKKIDSQYLKKKRWGLIGGFSLAATNPMMILWWLIGAKLFIDLKLISAITPDIAVVFLVAGVSGLASYLIFLSIFLYWAKRFISERTIKGINLAFGIIMLFIAFYFIYSSFSSFSRLS